MKPAFFAVMIMATSVTGTDGKDRAISVSTECGLVRGGSPDRNGVTAFKGIPYAAPPVGELRWRAPQSPQRWDGVRDATAFGNSCWSAPMPFPLPPSAPAQSEDCLTLNIWTPAIGGADNKPVMVWLHGGGFQFGSSAMPAYNGSFLAARGVIVVTVNYRLGVFGFLAHPELDGEGEGSGAYGLQDQVAALQWIRRNIAGFGGDPDNVTLFGESAGAHAVGLLMASQNAKGLFHRAIVQSGAFWDSENGSIPTHEEALAKGAALGKRLGVDDLNSLRALPAGDLNAKTAWNFLSDPSEQAFGPSIDGFLLRESPAAVFAKGGQHDMPLMGGWNAVEGLPFRPRALGQGGEAEFAAAAAKLFGEDRIAEFLALYPADTSDRAQNSALQLIGDLVISEQTWEMLGLHARAGRKPVFTYQFAYTSPYSPIASHVAEVPFVFGSLTPQFFAPQAPAANEDDRRLSDMMIGFWTNFAKAGDPNGDGLPKWPVYEGPDSAVMHFNASPAAGIETGAKRLQFLASFRREGRLPDAWRAPRDAGNRAK